MRYMHVKYVTFCVNKYPCSFNVVGDSNTAGSSQNRGTGAYDDMA